MMFKQRVVEGGRYLKPVNPRYPVIAINGGATIIGVVGAKTKTY
ncbi:MAG TPA: hypothetical protein VMV40_08730 [Acidiferrobacter sp.]|nr:hypothetical protein [Acidiferrobacter sp.]